MSRARRYTLGCALGSCALLGCGIGVYTPWKAPVPWEERFATLITGIPSDPEPLFVHADEPGQQRLWKAMERSLAVVSYTSSGLRVLERCSVEGSYSYWGQKARRREFVLSEPVEVWANMPKLLDRAEEDLGYQEPDVNAKIKVLVVQAGRWSSPLRHARPMDLKGECNGATHLVRGIAVGAFRIEQAKGGEEKGEKKGELPCGDASPDARKPGDKICDVPLWLELQAIGETAPDPELEAANGAACFERLVRTGGVCGAIKEKRPYLCPVGSPVTECERLCAEGDAQSCGAAANEQVTVSVTLVPLTMRESISLNYRVRSRGWSPERPEENKEKPAYLRALEALEQGCKLGSMLSCAELGIRYRDGLGVEVQREKALDLFEQACALGEPSGCLGLGTLAEREAKRAIAGGADGASSLKQAMELYRRACEGGWPEGCTAAGMLFQHGYGDLSDHGLKWYDWACRGGDAQGCYRLAVMLSKGDGVAQNEGRAVELYRYACENGIPDACMRMALRSGWTRRTNLNRIARYLSEVQCGDSSLACSARLDKIEPEPVVKNLQEDCVQGIARACDALGRSHSKRLFSMENEDGNQRLFEMACLLGDGAGCIHRALTCTSKDCDKHRLLSRACRYDDLQGCLELGLFYEQHPEAVPVDSGISKDICKGPQCALSLFHYACKEGLWAACAHLGHLYESGIGTERNHRIALDLYAQGCERGDTLACTNLSTHLRQNMPSEKSPIMAGFKQACEDHDDPSACAAYAFLLEEFSKGPEDLQLAAELFDKACTGMGEYGLRERNACSAFGRIHQKALDYVGKENPDITQQYQRIAGLFAGRLANAYSTVCFSDGELAGRSEDQVRAQACYLLGGHFMKGTGGFGEPDMERAQDAYERSCFLGLQPFPLGCSGLGQFYEYKSKGKGQSQAMRAKALQDAFRAYEFTCKIGRVPNACLDAFSMAVSEKSPIGSSAGEDMLRTLQSLCKRCPSSGFACDILPQIQSDRKGAMEVVARLRAKENIGEVIIPQVCQP